MKDALALSSVVALLFGVTCGLGGLPDEYVYYLFFVSLVFLGAWFFTRKNYYLFIFLPILFFALGLLRVQSIDYGLRAGLESSIGQSIEFEARVDALPDERENNTRLTVYIPEFDTNVLLVVPRYPKYQYGDTVTVSGKLSHPAPFETDGGRVFAYDKFLAKEGIGYIINFAQAEKTGETTSLLGAGTRKLFTLRDTFLSGLNASLIEPSSSLAAGILIGGKQGLGSALLEAFTVTGLLPIVVLSGYNIMIIIAAVLAVMPRVRPRYSFSVAGVFVTLFVIATGASTSAVRALLMGLLALFAKVLGRQYDAIRILVAVLALMVVWNPLMFLYDPGFQFSFAATLGIIILCPLLEVRFQFVKNRILREIVATTISAQLFVVPLLLYQTGNLSIVSVLANILVLPVVPFAMLLSFVAGVVGIFLPTLSVYAGLPAWGVLSYMILVAEVMAEVPLAHLIVPAFPAWVLVPSYALIGWLVFYLRKSNAR